MKNEKRHKSHTPKKNPQETSIEKCPLSEARFKAYNVPKKNPKWYFSQSLLRSVEVCLYRTSLVGTSGRDIILKQRFRISQLNQKTRTNYHLKNLPFSNLNHPLSQKLSHFYLKNGFWVDNWCQHIHNQYWEDFWYIWSLWSVGLISLLLIQGEFSLNF